MRKKRESWTGKVHERRGHNETKYTSGEDKSGVYIRTVGEGMVEKET